MIFYTLTHCEKSVKNIQVVKNGKFFKGCLSFEEKNPRNN